MSVAAARTLFHPFEGGALSPPSAGERALFVGAKPGFVLPEDFAAALACVQGFRPDYLHLRGAGLDVVPELEGDGYDLALVLASRHRAENEHRLAEALLRVKPGALVVMAGGNEDGVTALRKRLERNSPDAAAAGAAEPVPLAGHLSKHHGLVFWLVRTAPAERFARQVMASHEGRPLVDGRFRTAASSFSHDRIDPGSMLLAECLPADIKGQVADFCAGWGFLSVELATRAQPASLDLYEADHASLAAARDNMARLAPGAPARFFWHDLVGEAVAERYDAIVMNPPFHQTRAAEPGLGSAMIKAAARALKRGGRLFIVANRQLPYESALAGSFARVEKLREQAGFKVFMAVR